MSDLIAIGYPDEGTAAEALAEAERLQGDLLIRGGRDGGNRRDAREVPHDHPPAHGRRGRTYTGAFSSA